MSYSRSELGLVADLSPELRRTGLATWIDFEDLEPGRPWEPQILDAIDAAHVLVLIVSRRAIRSSHVDQEWRRALAAGTPVVLVIAQATSLPDELDGRPWVDLRRRTRKQMADVQRVILAARTSSTRWHADRPASHVPTRGFRAPASAWWALIASVPIALCALFSVWTIVLPAVLTPLPIRILRRSFSYVNVRNALSALPFAQAFWVFALQRSPGEWNTSPLAAPSSFALVLSIIAPPVMFVAIRSRSFRRWVGPAARRPDRRRWRTYTARAPTSIRYSIDHSTQDRLYAEALAAVFDQRGHRHVDRQSADLTVTLVSRFHQPADSIVQGGVLPVFISEPTGSLPDHITCVHWIDLRRGMDRRALGALAQHLDRPREFLANAGTVPASGTGVMPRGVAGLFYSLLAGAAVSIGAWLLLAIGTRDGLDKLDVGMVRLAIGMTVIAVAASLLLASAVRRRALRRVNVWTVLVVVSMASVAALLELSRPEMLVTVEDEGLSRARNAFAIPSVLLVWFAARHRLALRRWTSQGSDGTAETPPDPPHSKSVA